MTLFLSVSDKINKPWIVSSGTMISREQFSAEIFLISSLFKLSYRSKTWISFLLAIYKIF